MEHNETGFIINVEIRAIRILHNNFKVAQRLKICAQMVLNFLLPFSHVRFIKANVVMLCNILSYLLRVGFLFLNIHLNFVPEVKNKKIVKGSLIRS